MSRILLRRAAGVLAIVALAACEPGPSGPPEPVPGVLTLTLATPNADDRSMLISVSGPEAIATIEAANSAYAVHSRTSGATSKVAVFGAIANGALLKLHVPDVNKAANYTATVTEVGDGSNQLRGSTAGYALTVGK